MTDNDYVTKNILAIVLVIYSVLLVFQNPVSMILSGDSALVAKSVLGAKDLILYFSVFIVLLNMLVKPFKADYAFYSIFLVVLLSVVIFLNGNVSILSARQLLIIPLSLVFGSVLYKSKLDMQFVFNVYICCIVILVLFAYVERYILYDKYESFWNHLGVKDYMELKGVSQWSNKDSNVSNSFYSYDFYNYIGYKVRRMVSLIAEPTLFGELLVLPSVFYLLSKKYLLALFFIIPIFLALSKGGALGVLLGVGFYYWQEKSNKVIKVTLLVVFSVLLLSSYYLYINNYVQSVTNHINGLLSNIAILREYPFGLGVGNAGNYYNLIAAGENSTSGESYLGALVGQFGIIGLSSYVLFFYRVYKCKTSNTIMLSAIKYSMLAVLITGMVSESAISYVGTSLLLILTAYLFSYRS